MSAPNGSQGEHDAPAEASVLANLPRTRPQRSSPRRAAARAAASATDTAAAPAPAPAATNGHANGRAGTGAKGAGRARGRTGTAKRPAKARTAPEPSRARTSRPRAASAPAEPAPRQGFDCEGERASRTVHPPGGAELVTSAVEIVGELAKTGLSTGERLLKDALSRLPLS